MAKEYLSDFYIKMPILKNQIKKKPTGSPDINDEIQKDVRIPKISKKYSITEAGLRTVPQQGEPTWQQVLRNMVFHFTKT